MALNGKGIHEVTRVVKLPDTVIAVLREMTVKSATIGVDWQPEADTLALLAPYEDRAHNARAYLKAHRDGFVPVDGKNVPFVLDKDELKRWADELSFATVGKEANAPTGTVPQECIDTIVSKAMAKERNAYATAARRCKPDNSGLSFHTSANTGSRQFEFTCIRVATRSELIDQDTRKLDPKLAAAMGLKLAKPEPQATQAEIKAQAEIDRDNKARK